MDWVKDWWAIIVALLGGAMWIGKVQRDVEDLKSGKFVTNERCTERRQEMKENSALQFSAGDRQFIDIKKLISDNDERSEKRHSEVMSRLLDIARKE